MKLKDLRKIYQGELNFRVRLVVLPILAGVVIIGMVNTILAKPGDLDLTFGYNGTVLTPFNNFTFAFANSMALQADGKMVVAGYYSGNYYYDFAVVRYNSDGSPDPSFGVGGKVITSVGEYDDLATSVAIQPDGKIVVTGLKTRPDDFDFAVVRYNADGSLDSTFDGDGIVVTSFGPVGVSFDTAWVLEIQPDGKIVVAGDVKNTDNKDYFALARYNSNGSLDASFGNGGKVLKDTSRHLDDARSVIIQPDGKILVAGFSWWGDETGAVTALPEIVRFNANGTLDTAFGNGGVVITAVPNTLSSSFADIALQSDGKIVAAGQYVGNQSGSDTDFLVVRYNANGALDSTFDGDGIVTTKFSYQRDSIASLAVQSNGKIIVAGSSRASGDNDFAAARYNSDGSLDFGFGRGGTVTTSLGAEDVAKSVAIQPDGKVIIAGYSRAPNLGSFALARYHGNSVNSARPLFDFDGDGKTDISVYRPLTREWWYQQSSDHQVRAAQFGGNPIQLAPADYDGDRKTDIAFWQPSASDGTWRILRSSDNVVFSVQFGQNLDFVQPGDYDGDGRADISVFRPSEGKWYRLNSSNNQLVVTHFGLNRDQPLIADFDGDGKSDVAVWRPSDGVWYWLNSSNGQFNAIRFGLQEDIPVVGDFDGDGKSDISVFRRSEGIWHLLNSSNWQYTAIQFGLSEDIPVVGDYDGDGKSDIAVWRSSDSVWYRIESGSGEFKAQAFGRFSDKPVPSAFLRSCLTGVCASIP